MEMARTARRQATCSTINVLKLGSWPVTMGCGASTNASGEQPTPSVNNTPSGRDSEVHSSSQDKFLIKAKQLDKTPVIATVQLFEEKSNKLPKKQDDTTHHGKAVPKALAQPANSGNSGLTASATDERIGSLLDQRITRHWMSKIKSQGGKICAEYVWIGGTGSDLRSKGRTLDKKPKKPSDLPTWNYDGSSTGQAPGEDSEVYMVPRAIFRDPFRGGDNILVMTDTYKPPRLMPDGFVTPMVPLPTNTRAACAEIMEKFKDEEPWFGIEQEYTLLNSMTKWPLGWPRGGFPLGQGPYYCSAGAGVSIARDICEVHYRLCLYSGVNISGINGEVLPSQWEYQVGPCTGIDMGDHLWMSRYIMHRVGELYNVMITFDPKPIPGDWNGSGGHTNYSTKATRAPGGWDVIQEHCKKLEKRHAVHIAAYGEGNERRLTGKHETSGMNDFSWGVANRGCSIRVGRMVPIEKCGYYEDRRPASNLDPYVVCRLLVESTLSA